MKKLIITLTISAASIIITPFALGQTVSPPDSSEAKEIELFNQSLDSLVNLWHMSSSDISDLVPDTIPIEDLISLVPDSVYIDRLSKINSPISFTYNDKVKAYIELYAKRRRDQVERMLGQSEYYFPIFEQALDARNMPHELKYLPVIESAFNPVALSRAGASGIWQFMYYTGKRYGLEINSYVDERRDPVRSSEAAVKFLEDLYKIYGDWHLVIAAYNCGPGNVNKAIRRSGGKRDFWQIFYHLPRETRGYVPAFIAAAYIFNYYKDHNLYPKPTLMPIATDTLMVSKMLHFDQIASVLRVPVEHIRELNPQYRKDVIPASTTLYPLRLPFDYATTFASLEDSIYDFNREKFFAKGLTINPAVATATFRETATPHNQARITYTVKSGDALGLISDWFDVNVSDLRYWNNIHRNMIKVGQKLAIYVPKNKQTHYEAISNMSYAQKQSLKGKSVASQTQASATTTNEHHNSSDFEYYTVKSGDNLWTIAQKYPGVSNQDIMDWNNISDARKIAIGQKLKIKRKS